MEKYSYIDLVKTLPKPTSEQIDNFIDMFTYDHSWYKKLPKDRIHDFLFYINPNAGRTRQDIRKFDLSNGVYYWDFMDIDNDFNASKYQNKYGYLTYFVNQHPDIKFERNSQPIIELNHVNDSRILVPVPDEIFNKCTIKLSKYVAECYKHYSRDFIDEEDRLENVSYAQKHEEIIKDLKLHLLFIVEYIYG